MSDENVTQKLSTEGADPLSLAGVNDGNLVELSRLGGVKVALRGDTLTLSGPATFVDRAAGIASRMIEAARQRRDLTPDDVLRMGDAVDRPDGDDDYAPSGNGTGAGNTQRIALPGVRKVVVGPGVTPPDVWQTSRTADAFTAGVAAGNPGAAIGGGGPPGPPAGGGPRPGP